MMKIREVVLDINTGEEIEREVEAPRKTAAQKRREKENAWREEMAREARDPMEMIEDIIDAMAPTVRGRLSQETKDWHAKRKEIRARKP